MMLNGDCGTSCPLKVMMILDMQAVRTDRSIDSVESYLIVAFHRRIEDAVIRSIGILTKFNRTLDNQYYLFKGETTKAVLQTSSVCPLALTTTMAA